MAATSLAIEFALMPFALYHFHRAGLYGVAANLVAIPLTTFVIMPLEAAALIFDVVGLGGPFWTLTGWSISLLLQVAHSVADTPGASTVLPAMPRLAFALIIGGGLWFGMWSTNWRWWAAAPIAAGILLTIAEPLPDLLITGDGKHLAVIDERGTPWLLRDRTGDFVRDLMAENAGFDGDPPPLAAYPGRDAVPMPASPISAIRGGPCWRCARPSGSTGPSSPAPAPRPISSSPTAACRAAAVGAG